MIIGKEQYNKIYAMENFNINTNDNNIINAKREAVIIYLDIFNFSNKVKNFNADEITIYLKTFYDKVLPIINIHGGKVDKVIGDGIISVFCDIFDDRITKSNMFMHAYKCCEELITELNHFDNSKYKSKAAIAKGEVLFYKIDGNYYDYYEVTCIGEPLTIVHRLENEAYENEILFLENINTTYDPNSKWNFSSNVVNLKGIGNRKVNKMKLNL